MLALLCPLYLLVWQQQVRFFKNVEQTHLPQQPSPSAFTRRLVGCGSSPSANDGANPVWKAVAADFVEEIKEAYNCFTLATEPLVRSDSSVSVEEIVSVCDHLAQLSDSVGNSQNTSSQQSTSARYHLRLRALEYRRYELLCKLMRKDYGSYVATASFLSPDRIPREQLPNVQDIPYNKTRRTSNRSPLSDGSLVEDCDLDDMIYKENILDKTLLSIFRRLVETNTGGISSPKEGILGLVEQGRTFMLKQSQTPEAQHKMVYDTLAGLMTPVLPPFYRIFMSGIIPRAVAGKWGGKQVGPWFYAPWLTSFVTPTFFAFLVGPSRPNRRRDGELGGLLVEKCKFLQESGCKGLCLHQCKLPAQEFFQQELGLPLTVSPNFETQECQWSFGEKPVPPSQDPSFPRGCLVGCDSRKAVSGGGFADLCN